MIFTHPNIKGAVISLPDHEEIALGLLKNLVKLTGKSDKEYRQIFDQC